MVSGPLSHPSRNPLRILAVAALFLFGTLTPIVTPATAQDNVDLFVQVGPYFDEYQSSPTGLDTFPHCPGAPAAPAIRVMPDYGKQDQGVWQTRQVQVRGSSTDLTQVVFEYTNRAPPGTANAPALPLTIEWGGDIQGSESAGWGQVDISNSNTANGKSTLTFAGSKIPGGSAVGAIFTIAFRVKTESVGDTDRTIGPGTVSVVDGSPVVVGTDPGFTSFFVATDTFRVSGDAHQYKVKSVHSANTVTGSASTGSDTTHLKETGQDFVAKGVAPGAKLTIGSNVYTVTIVGTDTLTFSPAAPAALTAGTDYTIDVAAHIVLEQPIFGSSIQPSTGLSYVKLRPGTPATQMSFPIVVKGFEQNGVEHKTNTPGMCMVVDNTPPQVTSATTRDVDRNGLIDAYVLTFSEEMDPKTLVGGHFLIDASASGLAIPYSVLPLNSESLRKGAGSDLGHFPCPNPATDTDCLNMEKTLILSLAEGYKYDTGIVPQITYPAPGKIGTFADLAGNLLGPIKTTDLVEADGAKPVLVSTFAYEGAKSIIATFSEPVTGPAARAVRTDDFYYYDSCHQGPPGCITDTNSFAGDKSCISAMSGISPELGATDHTPGAANGHIAKIAILPPGQAPNGNPLGASCTVAGSSGPVIGQAGAGDVSQTLGDWIALSIDSGAPACPTTLNDFEPCNAILRDAVGLRAIPTATCLVGGQCTGGSGGMNAPRTTLPLVRNAVINIDTASVTLNFNGPMSDASGDTKPITLAALFVVSADGTGQGPGGILRITHEPGSNRAVLILDRKARATDVDDTPAKIGIRCNSIKGTQLNYFIPCADPDQVGGPGVNLVDLVPPAILHAETADLDRDGNVDGIFVEFNEPVDDSTFCQDTDPPVPPEYKVGAKRTPPLSCQPCPSGNCAIGFLHIDPFSTSTSTYVFDTDAAPGGPGDLGPKIGTGNGAANDRYGIIKILNPAPQGTGVGSLPGIGRIPSITTARGGFFADLSHPYITSPPYIAANPMNRICSVPFNTGPDCRATVVMNDGAPPVLLSATTVDSRVRITNGIGYDVEGNGFLDGYRLTFSEAIDPRSFCHDSRQNGPVYFCRTTEWAVEGRKIIGIRTLEPGMTTDDICEPFACNSFTLMFEEGPFPDTDERPKLTYIGPPEGSTLGLKDLAKNQMLPFNPIDGFERDGAAPVIVAVEGYLGRNNVTVRFSEPVDDGSQGPLKRLHLQYYNIDHLQEGVSGLQDQDAVDHAPRSDVANVRLNCPGSGPATATCGSTGLTAHDLQNDTLGAEPNSIWESTPFSVLAGPRQAVSTKTHGLGSAIDRFGPANVTAFKVIPQLTTANSVTLTWTAPGNDGNGFGPVAGYRIKVSEQKIGPNDFDNPAAPGTRGFGDSDPAAKPNPDGSPIVTMLLSPTMYVTFEPDSHALAGPGQFQKATIVGLDSQKTYHFAVAAFDNATLPCGYVRGPGFNNASFTPPPAPCLATDKSLVPYRHYSGMRPQDVSVTAANYDVTATTGTDLTPPSPTPVIASTTHRANTATPSGQLVVSWTEAVDPESKVTYHYALNQEPQYKVLANDGLYVGGSVSPSFSLKIPSKGTWYFHVAAFSGGGSTPTAHYTVIYGERSIDLGAIRDANNLVTTEAVRTSEGNLVTWTLPDAALLPPPVRLSPDAPLPPPGSNVQGIQIWRLDNCDGENPDCKAVLAVMLNMTYDELVENNSWLDNSTLATATSAYKVELVFKQDQTATPADQPHSIRDFAAVQAQPDNGSPWLWVALIVIVVVLLAAVFGAMAMAKRKRARSEAAFTEEPAAPPAAGMDPVTGMPTHDVRCPSCQTAFQAVGNLPLQITCPKCGVSGLLQ